MVILGILFFIGVFMAGLAGLVYVGSLQGRASESVQGFLVNDDYPPKPLDQEA